MIFLAIHSAADVDKMFYMNGWWLDLKPGPLVTEATTLPTVPDVSNLYDFFANWQLMEL